MKGLLCLLEERLVGHDNNRKEVQDQLQEMCAKTMEELDLLEEKINEEMHITFEKTEERILSLIEKLNNKEENDDKLNSFIKQALKEVSNEQKYEIQHTGKTGSLVGSYKLIVLSVKAKKKGNLSFKCDTTSRIECTISKLQKHLKKNHTSMIAAQNKLTEICSKKRMEINEVNNRINEKLERYFIQEDARIQGVVGLIRQSMDTGNVEDIDELSIKAKAVLVLVQRYELYDISGGKQDSNYDLIITRDVSLKLINFEERKPSNFIISFTNRGGISFSFSFFSNNEIEVLKQYDLLMKLTIITWEKDHNENTRKTFSREYRLWDIKPILLSGIFSSDTTYCLKMRIEYGSLCSEWSDDKEIASPEFSRWCSWKECPNIIGEEKRYFINKDNHRVATNINENYCTLIGNISLPVDTTTSWNIKILNLEGISIYIGVAPFDINQGSTINHEECGWYFNPQYLKLCSGPPHKYKNKLYGPFMFLLFKTFVYLGESIKVTMDTIRGELSFGVENRSYGIAYKGIPLDKPLVPCVILKHKTDSVEIIPSEAKGINVENSIPIPSNIVAKNTTWDSITITWNIFKGGSHYQIEVDGDKKLGVSTTKTFTKRGLLTDTDYIFKVRTVKGNSVSEWSDAVKLRTGKAPDFSECAWKKCTEYVAKERKKHIDKINSRIATKTGDDGYDKWYCTIVGDISIPLSTVTSWKIKILKINWNYIYGNSIYIGVAPSDICQNDDNSNICGWYFDCCNSVLSSGPPHNYRKREYGLGRNGKYVYTGDTACAVMDTTKGELSFVINGMNIGVAYEGIPLDKPLAPCVLLENKGDSVELDTSKIRVNEIDTSIPVLSVTTKNITWDSITLVWDSNDDASFYQIEVDGSKFWRGSTTNSFTKRGLLADTEHSFRVRIVNKDSVSEWSAAVKCRTRKVQDFSESTWKECPDYVEEDGKYSVDKSNRRIATSIGDDYCTIIGTAPLSLNRVASWNVKILKSSGNGGNFIYVGIAPFDIDQSDGKNYDKSGWYFYCFKSTLWSGPPHNYRDKEYGPRKELDGEYVHTRDSVGVVMDTVKGELSFVVNRVNLGTAYDGIPLDKPLVPCVLLGWKDESIEFTVIVKY